MTQSHNFYDDVATEQAGANKEFGENSADHFAANVRQMPLSSPEASTIGGGDPVKSKYSFGGLAKPGPKRKTIIIAGVVVAVSLVIVGGLMMISQPKKSSAPMQATAMPSGSPLGVHSAPMNSGPMSASDVKAPGGNPAPGVMGSEAAPVSSPGGQQAGPADFTGAPTADVAPSPAAPTLQATSQPAPLQSALPSPAPTEPLVAAAKPVATEVDKTAVINKQLRARIVELETQLAKAESAAAERAPQVVARPKVARVIEARSPEARKIVSGIRETVAPAGAATAIAVPSRASSTASSLNDMPRIIGVTSKPSGAVALIDFAGNKRTYAVGDTVVGLGQINQISIEGDAPAVSINGVIYR